MVVKVYRVSNSRKVKPELINSSEETQDWGRIADEDHIQDIIQSKEHLFEKNNLYMVKIEFDNGSIVTKYHTPGTENHNKTYYLSKYGRLESEFGSDLGSLLKDSFVSNKRRVFSFQTEDDYICEKYLVVQNRSLEWHEFTDKQKRKYTN